MIAPERQEEVDQQFVMSSVLALYLLDMTVVVVVVGKLEVYCSELLNVWLIL